MEHPFCGNTVEMEIKNIDRANFKILRWYV